MNFNISLLSNTLIRKRLNRAKAAPKILQRLMYAGIKGCMRMCPTVALDALFHFAPLHKSLRTLTSESPIDDDENALTPKFNISVG